MSALAESTSIKAMAEKIERLEKELATWHSASHLPSQLGDFARILRTHGIATVFHAGRIDPIDGGTAAESDSGSLFDATDGFDEVKKAKVA
ncbi:hypothetical protein [Caballeronia sp. S22]|uniref:hypothetical protein n=1 Tax=Caballeronia sp. S22 TaxID=3137182 RepID=UPI003530E744